MGAPSGAVDPNEASGLSLSAPERAALQVLRTAPGGPGLEETEVAEAARIPIEAARGSLQRLKGKHLAVSDEEHLERFRLTPRGSAALAEGLPERKLLRFLAAAGRPLEAADLGDSGLDPSARSAAIGILRRAGRLAAGASFAIAESVPAERPFPEELALPKISQGEGEIPSAVLESLKRRGLVVAERTTRRRWSASAEGRALPLVDGPDAIGAVTPDRLSSDTWRGV
ncbi:MAG TPA: hypothetical protein VGS18_01525, partial [Thermoplasmata archaeon]|nr:hypothetical protein [Thermoplasmata archaeon]